MEELKNVIICGLGAIGTVYAARLSECNDVNLYILLDKTRIKKYSAQPTVFNGKEYNFNYITDESARVKADIIIISTKNNGLSDAIKLIKNYISPSTIILSLLNGIKSEDEIAQVYGYDKILYSYYIGHTSTRNERNIIHDGIFKTVFGEKNNETLSQNVIRVKNFFDKTNIPYEIPVDMDFSRWWKFLVNIGYNQASAVLGATYGNFQSSKKLNSIAVELMREAVTIAKAEGVKNTDILIPKVLDVIKTMRPETKTSMLQDIESKRETEVDIFAGHIKELGKKHQIKTPYNDLFFEIIKALDEKNSLN